MNKVYAVSIGREYEGTTTTRIYADRDVAVGYARSYMRQWADDLDAEPDEIRETLQGENLKVQLGGEIVTVTTFEVK